MTTEPIDDTAAIVRTPPAGSGALQLGGLAVGGPRDLVRTATEIAGELAKIIDARGLAVDIKGRRYVRCEGWTTCAAMLGVVAREVEVREQEDGAFEAIVELVRIADQVVVGRGSAICAPDEPRWADAARYARRSMSVTRATGKACRLAFAWIVALSGYQGTPAEEVEDLEPAAADGQDPGAKRRASNVSRRAPARQRNTAPAQRPAAGQRSRTLGHDGAKRLLARLNGCGKNFQSLIVRLKATDLAAYEAVAGVAIEELPASAFAAIKNALDDFEAEAADAVREAAESQAQAPPPADPDFDEASIPF